MMDQLNFNYITLDLPDRLIFFAYNNPLSLSISSTETTYAQDLKKLSLMKKALFYWTLYTGTYFATAR